MSAVTESADIPAEDEFLTLFGAVSDAVESGAGLPEVARAAGRALASSVVVLDAGGSILAVACASPADERAVLDGADGSERIDLRVADSIVGRLLFRARKERPAPALLRMVGTLMALEVERSRGPERASEAAVGAFLTDLLDRRLTERADIEARGRELGIELAEGASVLIVRAHAHQPEEGDWRRRVLAVAERGARGVERSSLAAWLDLSLGRPSGASSFPSSHAAYAMTFVALAVVARRASGGLGRAALLVVALGLTAAIGLGRIFLGASHFSDVAAGWGLGAGVYAACAVVALLAVHLIQPGRARDAPAGEGIRVGAGRD